MLSSRGRRGRKRHRHPRPDARAQPFRGAAPHDRNLDQARAGDQRNQAAMKYVNLRANLRIHRLLEKHHDEIRRRYVHDRLRGAGGPERYPNYQRVPIEILEWRYTVVLRHLLNAVRTGEKGLFTAYCRDLAQKRYQEGFPGSEVCNALTLLSDTCLEVLAGDPEANDLDEALRDYLTMTVEFGCDQVMEIYDDLSGEST
jgi:hypothetical protein